MPIGDEAHQSSRSEATEATSDEEVRSVRANPSAAAPSAPGPKVLTIRAQQMEEMKLSWLLGWVPSSRDIAQRSPG